MYKKSPFDDWDNNRLAREYNSTLDLIERTRTIAEENSSAAMKLDEEVREKTRNASKVFGRVQYPSAQQDADLSKQMSLLTTANTAYDRLKALRSNLQAIEVEARIRGMI